MLRSPAIFSFLLFLLGHLFILSPVAAQSQVDEKARGQCRIAVRMLRVTDGPALDQSGMSSFLEDMDDQLKSLPFKGYETVDFKETVAVFGKRAKVVLRGANTPAYTLAVIPHERGQGRVHLTVDWRGPDRRSLLSTKLRVREGENVMLGTDKTSGRPLLVAIKVMC